MSALPPLHRPRDSYYTLFLLSYIPTIILFDSLPLYPPSLIPSSLSSTHTWYLTTFNDPLVRLQPPWFKFFSLAELFYQLPVAAYLAWALGKRAPSAPAHMLVWATLAAFTTATCCWEFYHSTLMTLQQKYMLGGMYGSYGLIFAIMAGDMFCRIQKTVSAAAKMAGQKKVR
ncbi:transmembrane protein 6/97 [Tricharina praecox]|uniref:transmembrane protein 6/97 n=1 Tax=Tricharina praecox TaxID=43433 RepID=UPI0022206907|nr:transmembrane protein 6/97 [Tricharina praecox]KAI5848857.1 transmembrane protein 6/97 [Tricharina praecox]